MIKHLTLAAAAALFALTTTTAFADQDDHHNRGHHHHHAAAAGTWAPAPHKSWKNHDGRVWNAATGTWIYRTGYANPNGTLNYGLHKAKGHRSHDRDHDGDRH